MSRVSRTTRRNRAASSGRRSSRISTEARGVLETEAWAKRTQARIGTQAQRSGGARGTGRIHERGALGDAREGWEQALKEAERDLDGAGRVLLRASGTEPLVRVMVEGVVESKVKLWAETIAEAVRKAS